MTGLHDLDLADVADTLRSRAVSSVEVTRHVLDRIDRLDGRLRSYATVTADLALAGAEAADAEIAAGRVRGALHGVPLAVKDLCATRDAPTHVGSLVLRDWRPGVDCTVVARLRAAGAVFLGKLQMTEAAYATYHPAVVAPVNPWGAGHWTGVSSSGPGVALSAGLCFGALGTDTGGSIRFPSHCCGVTGLKPTWGRVSRADVHAVSDSLDHVGPMARSAADVAVLLAIIAGRDPGDPTTLSAPVPDYVAEIERGIAGLRVGFDERYCAEGLEPVVTRMIADAVDVLRGRGTVVVPIRLPDTADVVRGWAKVCAPEAAIVHEATYPSRAAQYGPALARFLDLGRALGGVACARAQLARQKFAGELSALFDDVDVIVSPTLPYPTPSNAFMESLSSEEGAVDRLIAFAAPHNMSGHPTLSLPGGLDAAGLPLGFQLVGPHLGEALLLRAGHAYQQDTGWHRRRPDID